MKAILSYYIALKLVYKFRFVYLMPFAQHWESVSIDKAVHRRVYQSSMDSIHYLFEYTHYNTLYLKENS